MTDKDETAVRPTVADAARAALQGEKAVLTSRDFQEFLAGIATGVIRNVLEVRAGKLKPDEAGERDDATVRQLAQILMGEHDRIRLAPEAGSPEPGPALVAEMQKNLPALFRGLPAGADPKNPRALMVHAARVFLREIYAMVKAAAADGEKLTDQVLRVRIERLAAVWAARFTGDALGDPANGEAAR